MRGLWLSLCMFTSFPNFALFVFICQFQGFLFGAILVHTRHRETTGVLNGSPQFGFDGLRFDFAGTRRLSAPGGHLVGPGDILPTGS